MKTKIELNTAQAKVKSSRHYEIARRAWNFFLTAHGDECDMDAAIDTIAEGVLEIFYEEFPK